jgi:hypothetical protein
MLSVDHVVLVVKDLSTGTRHFKELGFTVAPGGVHAGGLTHNALIGLADGAYLELVAATRRSLSSLLRLIQLTHSWQIYPPARSPMGRRFLGLIANGPGLGDYALLSPDLESTLNEVQARGLSLEGPFPGSRMRSDGQQVSWRTAVPTTTDLPFLIEDVSPHDLRLPPEASRQHQNGATGVAEIKVLVADLKTSVARYQALLGRKADLREPAQTKGMRSAKFQMEDHTAITLVESVDPEPGSRRDLASRQGRPFRLNLRSADGEVLSIYLDSPLLGWILRPL